LAALGNKRSRNGSNPTPNEIEKVRTQLIRPVRPVPVPKRSPRRGVLGHIVVMSIAAGLVATVALPAYAFAPGSGQTQFGATESTKLAKTGEQSVNVAAQAATVSVARDGFTATTREELAARAAAAAAAAAAAVAAAAAEARRQEVAAQMTSYAAAYSGPSAADYLASPAHPNFDLASVYSVALQYQGVPYVYGGATPAGFDCSGFVMYVYAQFGISLPHSSTAQGAAGTRISLADAQPGDLVIMSGHDGFYAGNGNILHAPYEGASVRVQPLWTSDYYIVRLGI
jgi:cell wall-associated NlpC family hydrolase